MPSNSRTAAWEAHMTERLRQTAVMNPDLVPEIIQLDEHDAPFYDTDVHNQFSYQMFRIGNFTGKVCNSLHISQRIS